MPPTPVNSHFFMHLAPLEHHFWCIWVHLGTLFGSLVLPGALEGSPDAPETLSEWPTARPVAENAAI